MPRNRAYCYKNLALFAVDRGALDEAVPFIAEVHRLEAIVGHAYWHVELDYIGARLAARRGDLSAARALVEVGMTRARAAKSQPDLGIGHKYRGELLSLAGDTGDALAALDEAEAILADADQGELARAWGTRVRVLARAGRPDAELRTRAEEALTRLGAALDLAALDDPSYI
jgi:tetratricopeptide (TPR) repeat protein